VVLVQGGLEQVREIVVLENVDKVHLPVGYMLLEEQRLTGH
jgi:hypothetical protein